MREGIEDTDPLLYEYDFEMVDLYEPKEKST